MKTPSWYIPRRTLLQTAGTAIGLPVLEAMIKPGARAALPPPPRRYASIHGQVYGFVGRDDPNMNTKVAPWGSSKPGASVPLENNTHLRFFFDKKVDSKVTILTGLTERVLWGTHDAPVKMVAGSYPLAMYINMCGILTATATSETSMPPLPKPDPFRGATADQIAANYLKQFTDIPYLSLGLQRIGGNYDGFGLSHKSATEPVPSDRDPKSVFDRLFAGYDPGATAADVQRRARYRKSVLDGVRKEAGSLTSRLGRSDKQKVTGYLDSVSDLEKLVARAGMQPPVGVKAPPSGGSGDTEMKAMYSLIANAFITDRTRVVAFSGVFPGDWLHQRAAGQENLDYTQYRKFTGQPLVGDHHNVSHYTSGLDGGSPSDALTKQKIEWMEAYTHWNLDLYADFLAQLEAQMDVDGISTVLDNTVAVYTGDNSDSAEHACASQACILGGHGGASAGGWRIRSGREIRFGAAKPNDQILYAFLRKQPYPLWPGERSWKDLLWGIMNILGVPDPSDGKSPMKSFPYANHPLDQDLL